MARGIKHSSSNIMTDLPIHPIISDDCHRDTLDRVGHVIELLKVFGFLLNVLILRKELFEHRNPRVG